MATAAETRPLVDAEEDELAAVDAGFIRAFGRDMSIWDPEIRALYDDALADIYARYPSTEALS